MQIDNYNFNQIFFNKSYKSPKSSVAIKIIIDTKRKTHNCAFYFGGTEGS